MKNILFVLATIALLASCNSNAQEGPKRYEIKSGIVKYSYSTTGKVVGSSITGSGTESLYFKEYGAVELQEVITKQLTRTKIFGTENTETEHTHSMLKLDNGTSYSVDYDQKKIYQHQDMAMNAIMAFQPNADAGAAGKQLFESMGGKKIGDESILGYSCEIWLLSGVKLWIYKGIMLKSTATVMGITSTTLAQSAEFNISVSDAYFKLPDFPIQKQESFSGVQMDEGDWEDMDTEMDRMNKMSFAEWKEVVQQNDEEMSEMSDEELRKTFDMMQKMLEIRNK